MTISWSDRARRDLHSIYAYIAEDNPIAARRWIARLQEKANSAALAPGAGRVVPEVEKTDVREVFLRSYRIVYRVLQNEIHVLTVFEGHRLFPTAAVECDDDAS